MSRPDVKYKTIKGYVPIGLPPIEELAEESGLNGDRFIVFFHQWYMTRLLQMSSEKIRETEMHIQGWAALHSDLLERSVGSDYKRWVEFLEKKRIIQLRRDPITGRVKYNPGKRSVQYRISPEMFMGEDIERYRKETITDHRTLHAIIKLKEMKRLEQIERAVLDLNCMRLNEMMTKVKFDLPSARMFLDQVVKGKIKIRKTKKGGERNYADMLLQMQAFNEGLSRPVLKDKFGERFHTVFTSLWKPLRPFIRLDGSDEAPGVTDIANSQPYFSSIAINPNLIEQILPEFKACIPVLQKLKGMPDYELFAKLCAEGSLYEHWMSLRGMTKEERDDAKEEIFRNMFSKNRMPNKMRYGKPNPEYVMRSMFKEEFPSVAKAFQIIKSMSEKELPFIENLFLDKKGVFEGKKGYHKSLAAMMQKMESRIFLGRIVPRLLKLGIGPFLTVHDSVIMKPEYLKLVEDEIRSEFLALGVHPPKLK